MLIFIISAFQQKLLWEKVLGHFLNGFGSPSWNQEAPSWAHVATKAQEKQQQKLSKKSPSSQVASGKLETAEMMAGDGEGERCFEAIF